MKRGLALIFIGALALALALAVPPALRMANVSALAALARGEADSAARSFEILARLGHADAMNNLAVIRVRGLDGRRDVAAAKELLRRSWDKGQPIAGYNLARLAESRFDTPIEEVAQTLAWLEPLVAAGDPHAAAEMADALGYRNRAALVPDLTERRLELRRAAARDGDPVYTYRLARTMWDEAGERKDPALALEAIETMQRAAEAGERRAMLHMGNMEWQSPGWVEDALGPEGFPGGDRFDWWARGAEAGDIPSACRYAVNAFRSLDNAEALPAVHAGPRPETDARTEAALVHLATCAGAERVPGLINPVFGAPALYLGRPVGGVSLERSSRAAAKTILGVLYHEGRLVDRDPERARALLAEAAPDNDRAAALLADLPG